MMVDMKVSGLTMDPLTNMPILVLKDKDGRHAVPIWIGLVEASAIATELERVRLSRPMTHDLLHNILGHMGARLDRIEIADLRDSTFYASLFLQCGDGREIQVDARPSDAIALALRAGAAIRVAKKVIERARKLDLRKVARDATPTPLGPASGKSSKEPCKTQASAQRELPLLDPLPGKVLVMPRRPGGVATPPESAADPAMADAFRDLLESLPDEEFGKWKM
jgi:bifunctional DNase/RNase